MKRIIAIIGAGVLLLLTGCASGNVAASIGTTQIPVATVQSTISHILSEREQVTTSGMNLQTGLALNTAVMRFHIISVLFDKIAAAKHLTISAAEIAKRRANIITQIGSEIQLPTALVKAGIAKIDFPRYLKTVLTAEKLSSIAAASGDTSTDGSAIQKMIIEITNSQKVDINPRYGSWDYANANVIPAKANDAVVNK